MCGLVGLDWEARQRRANQILSSTEWKQKLCNDFIGLSFRELEQTLTSIASERQKKEISYERKLKAYSDKAAGSRNGSRPKSLRGDSPEPNNLHEIPKRLPPRTLEQILAQVYAPRESPESAVERDDSVLAFYRRRGNERNEDLLSGSSDKDDTSEKSTG